MNDTDLLENIHEKGCFPHQAEFAAAFFTADGARKHLLVSTPGMGKGGSAAAIVNHALSTGLAHRVLVLAPIRITCSMAGDDSARRCQRPVTIVDRRRLRELEDSQPVGQEVWPANAVCYPVDRLCQARGCRRRTFQVVVGSTDCR